MSCEGSPRARGKGQKSPCHVCGVGAHHSTLPFYLVPNPREGTCRADRGLWGGHWSEQGSGSHVRLLPSPVAWLGCCPAWALWPPLVCDELPGLSPEGDGGARDLVWGPREAMGEKKPEQCTNPFILLVCQRLVRAGWSQHVCGALSRLPPPGEGPGKQLGAVAEEARGGGSTVRQGMGWGEGMPPRPPIGVQAAVPGTCPGCLPRDPFPGPGDVCPVSGGGQPGAPSPGLARQPSPPALALLQGAKRGPRQHGGGLSAHCRGWPRGQWGLGGGSVSSGHEDAWRDGAHPGTETLMRERGPAGPRHGRASGGDDGVGGRGRGVPAPRVPLYTVGGARRPLLPVLKYCSLTDMALTMGPEMRGGGGPLQPPDAGAHWAAPGDPRARGPGMGELRAGRLALCFGLGPGRDGAGGWQCWGRGQASGGLPGSPGRAGGAGQGAQGATPGGAGRAWGAPSLPRGYISAFGPGSPCPARAAPLWHGVVVGPCLDRTGRVFGLVRGKGRRGCGDPPPRGQGN